MTNVIVAPRSADVAVAPTSRDDRIETDLAQLAGLDLAGLRQRWRRMVGRPAPGHLPRPLLYRLLAYRIQAAAFGDLDRETARQLDRLGRGMTDEPDRQAGGRAAEPIPPAAQASRPGTLLVREWQGSLQRVTVLEQGFAWGGRRYDSLSSVARAITGTNWNGPRFFGLRTQGKKKAPGQATESGGGAR
ncbi:DUF2924 domain-containing protein [Methylobacterium sp. P5_C11]